MQLDVPTLMVAGAFVALMSSAVLLYGWYHLRETEAALWWSAAAFLTGVSIILLAIGPQFGSPWPVRAALTMLILASALTWAGARVFDGLSTPPVWLFGGTALWIAGFAIHYTPDTYWVGTLHKSLTNLAYYAAAAWSLHAGRGESLRARTPLAILLLVHGLAIMLAVPASLEARTAAGAAPGVLNWNGVILFEGLVFAIGTAIFLIVMMKERSEGRLLATSHTDLLTGIANRRGFFEKAGRALDRCRRDGAPVSAIVFDLDFFKGINDRFGHPTGDRTLQIFAQTAALMLRPADIVGRIGGEEFAVLLPGSGVEVGRAVAERIRRAVAECGAYVEGNAVNCTVSAGVTCGEGGTGIQTLLNQADAALYLAKSRGRNRVETFHGQRDAIPEGNVIRVA
jgi:diguanylate cyclase (GGDEF)-like protein